MINAANDADSGTYAGSTGFPDASIFAHPPEMARQLIRDRVPEWRDANLFLGETSWKLDADCLDALSLLTLRALGLENGRPFDKDHKAAFQLFNEQCALAKWDVRFLGDHVGLDALFIDRRDQLGERLRVSERKYLLRQKSAPMFEAVMMFSAPSGQRFAMVFVERALSDTARPVRVCYDVHPNGDGAALLEFSEEYTRFLNLIQEKIVGVKPNEAVFVANTGSVIELDDTTAWDRLVLPDTAEREIRGDFRFFREHEEWFLRNHLPYKRSYLLAGPPGNGKTSIVRALAKTAGFSAVTFDFAAADPGEQSQLRDAFALAASRAPCLFIMEDIDRLFGEESGPAPREAILNCLDGVGAYHGVVVVATANHPDRLDEALRRRPGRFDRVVRLDNPDRGLRLKFLERMFGDSPDAKVEQKTLEKMADAGDGFSMAHLKEVFIGAGRECLLGDRLEITDDDAWNAFVAVREQFADNAEKRAGFARG